MEKKTIGITLFSVGVLVVQTLSGPALMAYEGGQKKTEDISGMTVSEEAAAGKGHSTLMAEASISSDEIVASGVSADEIEATLSDPYEDSIQEVREEQDLKPEEHLDPEQTEDEPTLESEEQPVPEETETIPTPELAPDNSPEEGIVEPEVKPEIQPEEKEELLEEEETGEIGEAWPNSPDNQQQPEDQQVETGPSVSIPAPELSNLTPAFSGPSAESLIDAHFQSGEITESNLGSFSLPLLSSFEYSWQAAIVYAAIRHVGQDAQTKTTEEWQEELYASIADDTVTFDVQKVSLEAVQPGDLLYNENDPSNQAKGIYLTEGYVASLETIEEAETSVARVTVQQLEEFTIIKRPVNVSLTSMGESLVTEYPAPYDFHVNEETQRFISEIAEEAQKLGRTYDVFASVLLAQAILESGSGTSGLSKAPYYNLFGIKGSYQGQQVVMPTQEDRGNGEMITIHSAFRSYGSYEASLADYIQLIRGGLSHDTAYYQEVWRSEAKNYLRATEALTGSYATDTAYHKKLNSLIAAYSLTAYDQPLVTETGVFIQGTENIPAEYLRLMSFPVYDGKDYNTSGSYPVGQCTWYAFNRVAQLGGRVDDYMGNGGDWATTGRRLGYQVSQTPKAGTLISFSHGTAGSNPQYGHVAFVEAVGPQGILISEGNVVGGTTISYRVISNDLAYSSQVSYITPK